MTTSTRVRGGLVATLALLLCGLLASSGANAETMQAQSPPTNVSGETQDPAAQVARHLLAYDTSAARRVLEDLGGEAKPWVTIARGRMLAQEGDYEAATAELGRAADADPRNPAPALFLGEALAYSGQQDAAGEAYGRAESRARTLLEAAPDDPKALYLLGAAQQRQKRFAESAATLERARSLNPDDVLIPLELGITRFYQQQWQAAFDLLNAVLERNSGVAYAYYYRGLAAGKLDRKDLLYNDLDRFVTMAPNAPEAANASQILASFG